MEDCLFSFGISYKGSSLMLGKQCSCAEAPHEEATPTPPSQLHVSVSISLVRLVKVKPKALFFLRGALRPLTLRKQ